MSSTEILKRGGMETDKWASNNSDLLDNDSPSIAQDHGKDIQSEASVKTLGLRWNPSQDDFTFDPEVIQLSPNPTKRIILANIARLFDPLGWISPVIVTAKIIMQDLWILKIGWDSLLPSQISQRWAVFLDNLAHLRKLTIPRWLHTLKQGRSEIHGFADASSRAYAAAVYLRTIDDEGHIHVHLLAAKCKLSPVKTVTIPNLELCAAAALVKLILYLKQLNFLQDIPIVNWSDSKVVLAWLKKHPSQWKVFVANRVSLIQTELPSAEWRHVPTKDNPADLATRGVTPAELCSSRLWWNGPPWLSQSEDAWPPLHPEDASLPDPPRKAMTSRITEPEDHIVTHCSNWKRMVRATAYCLRVATFCRKGITKGRASFPSFLTTEELITAKKRLIRLAQRTAFQIEIKALTEGKKIPGTSDLLSLNPFLDKDGLIRVGGRLGNSTLGWDQKHPPILPRRSHLSDIIIDDAHLSCLHGGPTETLSVSRKEAWIIRAASKAKRCARMCRNCFKYRPKLGHQMMGNLPPDRTTLVHPFQTSGVDYAGPIQMSMSKGRGRKSCKGYICLFKCFATKAIYLEAVSDLSTQGFIAAFRRFTGRRGPCRTLWSDNGTNFKGASKELRSMFNQASDFYKEVACCLNADLTTWRFIPPAAPHQGGFWESGIKSAKSHLMRSFGQRVFTFEEMTTILVQIEVCLNTRPLTPLTDDPEDLEALTPAHFLIGRAPGLLPEAPTPDVPEDRLTRYKRMVRVRDQFWKRWSTEFLHTLQERTKWRVPADNFRVGQVVLVKDDRYPSAKWPLGRITSVRTGSDGLVRSVFLKTASGTLERPIVKLAPLPMERPKSPTAGGEK